eukprot:414499-Prorocentrum_minimum.AAC.1
MASAPRVGVFFKLARHRVTHHCEPWGSVGSDACARPFFAARSVAKRLFVSLVFRRFVWSVAKRLFVSLVFRLSLGRLRADSVI